MKYTILINQLAIVHFGLHKSTDFVDWAFLEYIADWQIHGRAFRLNDHVWLDYGHLLDEMPMLGLTRKSSVSNRIKKLISLGLISTIYDQDSRIYVKTTDLYSDICRFRPVRLADQTTQIKRANHKPVHSEEPPVHSEEPPVHSEEPPVHSEEPLLNNQLINNQDQKEKETLYRVSKKKIETPNGKRFDLDILPNIWRQFCIDERPGLNADIVFARFRDYWIAQPGAKGRKLDWFATWRNWVRNENLRSGNGSHQQSGQHRKLSLAERAQQDVERIEARERCEQQRKERIVN